MTLEQMMREKAHHDAGRDEFLRCAEEQWGTEGNETAALAAAQIAMVHQLAADALDREIDRKVAS